MRIRIGLVERREGDRVTEVIPNPGRYQLRRSYGDGKCVIDRLAVGLGIGGIEPAHERIEAQSAKSLIAFGGKFSGLIRHAPHALQEVEVLAEGMAKMALQKHRPLAPADDAHLDLVV